MAYDIQPINTGDGTTAQDAQAVREMWQQGVDVHDASKDFFRDLEGTGKDAVIMVKDQPSKGQGHTITFTNLSPFKKEPHHGDDYFENSTDYEKIRIGTYQLTVDYLRHASNYNERMEEVMGMRNELAHNIPEMLGEWMGRQKTEKMQMALIHKGSADSAYYAGAGTLDGIVKTDTLTYDEVLKAGTMLKPRGGVPAKMGSDASGNPVYGYCLVATVDALYSLKNDSTYRQMVRDAGTRGGNNVLFTGGYEKIDNHFIKEYNPIDDDGVGATGSPQNPTMELGIAIAAGTTGSLDITGGGDATAAAETDVFYSKWFPKYDYKFIAGDVLDASADPTFYVIIYNVADSLAGNDKGKWGFYAISTNNGNKLTTNNTNGDSAGAGARLAGTTSGKASTQIGNVVWDAEKNTTDHPAGSKVILANANGVPIGHTFLMGRMAALRGYGKHRNRRTQQIHEGGYITDVYCTSVFGQTPRFDRKNRSRGYLTITHAIEYAGLNIDPTLA